MKGPTNSSARPNIRLLNVSATFESNPDTSNNTEFPYRASIQADGVSEYMSATVMFSQIQATSGNFATYCQTGEDVVYIYSKTDAGTITIPAVSCDLAVNYINMDSVPTEDSQAVITSGGVYTNCVRTSGDQTVAGHKTFTDTAFLTGSDNISRQLYVKNDTAELGVVPQTNQYSVIEFVDKNATTTNLSRIGEVMHSFQTDGSSFTGLRVYKNNVTTANVDFKLIYPPSDSNDGPYMAGPYRAYNPSNVNDVVTIGSFKEGTAWIKQTSDNLGRLATCNEVMLRGTYTSSGRTCEVSTIHPGNASGGINLAISYLNTYYGVLYIHPTSIYTVASSGNWDAFEVYFR